MNVAAISEHTVEVARVGDSIMAMLFGGCRVVIMDGKIRYEGWVPYVESEEDNRVFLAIYAWAICVRELVKMGLSERVRFGEYEPGDFSVEVAKLALIVGFPFKEYTMCLPTSDADRLLKSRSGKVKS